MTSANKPVYLLARDDAWLASNDVKTAALAFGTRDDAQKHADWLSKTEGTDPDAFRIVEYTFSEATKA